jgi:hypothetical protein
MFIDKQKLFLICTFLSLVLVSCDSAGDSTPDPDPITPPVVTYRVHATLTGAGSGDQNGLWVKAMAFRSDEDAYSAENAIAYASEIIMGGTASDMFSITASPYSAYDFTEGSYDILLFIDENANSYGTDEPDAGDLWAIRDNVLIDSFDDVTFEFSELTEF